MDGILSEFIARTSANPGLAADLLDGHGWDLQSALSAYYVMKGILPGQVPSFKNEFIPEHDKSLKSAPHHMKTLPEEGSFETNFSPRPPLQKQASIDVDDDNSKKLTRGISRATENVSLVTKARNEFAQDFGISWRNRLMPSKLEIPDCAFTLPDLSVYPNGLREYLERDLIETSTLVSLEQAGRLNWWHTKNICRKLWPLATTGDGNCLLHAASLGMWGFHDRLLTLRKALHTLLTCSTLTDSFYRRWRWQTTLQNKEAGLIYCEEEWQKEWLNLLKMSSTEPRSKNFQRSSSENSNYSSSHASMSDEEQPDVYESLEELHVLALAHVLRRPIIVIADTVLKDVTGEPFAPIPFGGIYLPLECQPSECHRSPLCLTYDSAHFSALVPMDEDLGEGEASTLAAIPVTDPDNKLLSLQFAVDPGEEVKWGQDDDDNWVIARLTLTDKEKLILLNEYLDIRNVPVECEDVCCPNDIYEKMNGVAVDVKKQDDIYESDESSAGTGISCTGGKHHKSKAARQLQTVAKQFGSIGKSVSKKLKNIGNIARRGNSFKGESETYKQTSEGLKSKRTLSGLPMISDSATTNGNFNPHQVIIAMLHTEKKHEYQREMIQNYLSSAVARYERDKELKEGFVMVDKVGPHELPYAECINPGCNMYACAATSYLCVSCYNKQKLQEVELEGRRQALLHQQRTIVEGPVISSGKSVFYTESDRDMIESVGKVPLAVSLHNRPCHGQNKSIFYDKFLHESMQTTVSSLPDFKERALCGKASLVNGSFQESATS